MNKFNKYATHVITCRGNLSVQPKLVAYMTEQFRRCTVTYTSVSAISEGCLNLSYCYARFNSESLKDSNPSNFAHLFCIG